MADYKADSLNVGGRKQERLKKFASDCRSFRLLMLRLAVSVFFLANFYADVVKIRRNFRYKKRMPIHVFHLRDKPAVAMHRHQMMNVRSVRVVVED